MRRLHTTSAPRFHRLTRSAPWLLRLLLITLFGVLLVLPSSQTAKQQPTGQSVPSAGVSNDALAASNFQQQTRANTDLPSKRYHLPSNTPNVLRRLPKPTAAELRPSSPRQIGKARAVNLSSRNAGRLFNNSDGSNVRLITIQSPGALELRVHFANFDLPEGEEIYIYGVSGTSPVAGPYRGHGPVPNPDGGKGAQEFWSDIIPGDTVIIEHYFQGVGGAFTVAEVAHHYTAFLSPQSPNLLPACHKDANCTSDILNDAVARIAYMENNDAKSCTGTMLNDSASNEFAPYFLTANHCVSNNAVAATVQARWHYRSIFCDSNQVAEGFVSPTGARVLNTEASSDQTLLRILGQVPLNQIYAGWTTDPQGNNASVYGLHHPDGSFLRRSTGLIINTNQACPVSALTDGYRVDWNTNMGATEEGSSGSGLFTSGGSLVGVDSCERCPTDQPCTLPACDTHAVYGKFSNFKDDIATFLDFGDYGVSAPPPATSLPFTKNGTLTSSPPATASPASRVKGVGWYGESIRFNGSAGQRIEMLLTSMAFDTELYLLAPIQRRLVASNNDSGSGTNSRIIVTLPETGEYIAHVTTAGSLQTGAYQLIVNIGTCYSISPTSKSFAASAGSGSIMVTGNASCGGWTAVSNNPDWLTVTPGMGGPGNGTVSYSVAANNAANAVPRTGTITIADNIFSVIQAAPTVLFNEAFSDGIPSTWSVVHLGNSATWSVVNSSGSTTINPCFRKIAAPISAPFAIMDSDCAGPFGTQDEQLITPTINATGINKAVLEFNHQFLRFPGGFSEIAEVDVTTNDFQTWTNVLRLPAVPPSDVGHPTPKSEAIDISAVIASNPANVKIRFHYYNANWEWWWAIDNVKVRSGCDYTLNPGSTINQESRHFAMSGGTDSITFTAPIPSGCMWTAVSNDPSWLTITPPLSGTGNCTAANNCAVSYTVAPNAGENPRTGTILVAGKTFYVKQAGSVLLVVEGFTNGIPPGWMTNNANGNGPRSTWTTTNPCYRVMNAQFFDPAFTILDNSLDCSDPNHGDTTDSQLITMPINASCPGQVVLEFSQQFVKNGNEIADVDVSTNNGQSWAPLLHMDTSHPASNMRMNITQQISANPANAQIRFRYSKPGAPFAGKRTSVQPGDPNRPLVELESLYAVDDGKLHCIKIDPSILVVPASGSAGIVNLSATSGYDWTVQNNAPSWITFPTTGGTGSAALYYTVAFNPGPPRTGTVTIAGNSFTVTQESGCEFTLSTTSQGFSSFSGGGSISVTASNAACSTWTAQSNAPSWITIIGVTIGGNGNGTVNYFVGANAGAQRTGTITVAGQTFTITQAATCQAITVNPTTLPAGAVGTAYNQTISASPAGGNYTFAVTSGVLPAGLSLNATTGALNGTPVAAGTANFTITATGFGTCTGSRAYTVTVNPASSAINVNSLADTATASDGQCTLREAINNVNSAGQTTGGDCASGATATTIILNLIGTINLTGALPNLSRSQTIVAPGPTLLTVRRSTGGDYRIFTINSGMTVSIAGLTITNGRTTDGGGIQNNGGALRLTNCVISGNTATSFSGGIDNIDGSLTITNSTISGNISGIGGGIGGFDAVLMITGSTISSNTASQIGSGIVLQNSTTTLTNCTISGNKSNGTGSGIYHLVSAGFTSVLALTNCTVTANSSGGNGSTLAAVDSGSAVSAEIKLKNTLVAANTGLNFSTSGTAAMVTSQGNNFDSDGTSGFVNDVNGNIVGTTLQQKDARLAPLANYGGQTYTHALLCNSPAINTGNNTGAPATDQRGVARPVGGTVDIGAFDATINISPTILPAGTRSMGYSQTVAASGGAAPYSFTIQPRRFDNNGSFPIPDSPAAGVDVPLTVSGTTSTIAKITVSLQLNHAFDSDLRLQLISPDNTVVTLSERRGSSGANYGAACFPDSNRTVFDDAAANAIASGTPPYVGVFRPDQPLTAFNGKSGTAVNGVWKLRVIDLDALITGTVNCVSLFISEALPAPGLALSSTGFISGTPTQAGNFNFTTIATDNNGYAGACGYAFTINCPAITVSPTNQTLSNGTTGTPYTQSFTQSGGVGTITWNSAGLPAGLSLNQVSGALTGSPTGSGTFNFAVRATDSNGCFGSRVYTLVINCPVITLATATLPSGTVGAFYNQSITQIGGAGVVNFTIFAGSLPSGLSFSTGGVLSGTASTSGLFSFTVRATDSNGCAGDRAYTLAINSASATITVNSLADTATSGDSQCTLREAISNANAAGQTTGGECTAGALTTTINFSVTGIINLTGALPKLNSNLTINGPSPSQLTVRRNTGGDYRIFGINSGKTVAIAGLTISNGLAPTGQSGGGIDNSAALSLTNCVISGNATSATSGFGGGVSSGGTLAITNCTINGNTAFAGGGLANFGPLVMSNSTISGNTASGQAGGLNLQDTTATLTNCTISGNTGNGFGVGGILNIDFFTGQASTVLLANCTVSGNTGINGAGIGTHNISGGGGVVTQLKNTLIAANTSQNFVTAGTNATLVSQGNNLDSDGTSGFINGVGGNIVGTQANPINALLAPLGNYGGPTQTHLLLAGSPARNAGNNTGAPATDQRSFARPVSGVVDIGSVENEVTLTITPASLSNGQLGQPYGQQLTQTGGTGTITWTVSSGGLPNNVSLNPSTGLLSGTPTANGTFNFTVIVTSQNGLAGVKTYQIIIGCPVINITPGTLPAGMVGAAYSQQLTATGGTPGYTFTVSVNAPPPGLMLSPSGLLSGTPSAAGSTTFTVKVTDSAGCMGTQSYTLTINASGTAGLQFYPLPRPVRLLDTRASQGNCDNVSTPIPAGTSITTQARITCESIAIPSTAQAIVGNVTVLNGTNQTGFLTIYPAGQPLPLAANMIYTSGDIISNAFTVGLNASGEFNIFGERTIDVVVDISGYYAPPLPAGLYYHPLPKPIRLLDTRAAEGNCDSVSTPIPAGTSLTTQARITCESLTIPAAAQAIVGNATVINGSGQTGYLTIYPNGVQVPLAANMVYFPGQILSNAFTVSLNAAGEFNIFGERTINMVIDVAGYYSTEANDVNGAGLLFAPLARPLRILDTRASQGNCDNIASPIPAGTSIAVPARITCESITIPAAAQTVIGTVTVINPNPIAGFMTMYPDGVPQPLAANMVYFPGQLLSNAFAVGLNATSGQFRIFGERTIEAIVDVSGYFAP